MLDKYQLIDIHISFEHRAIKISACDLFQIFKLFLYWMRFKIILQSSLNSVLYIFFHLLRISKHIQISSEILFLHDKPLVAVPPLEALFSVEFVLVIVRSRSELLLRVQSLFEPLLLGQVVEGL